MKVIVPNTPRLRAIVTPSRTIGHVIPNLEVRPINREVGTTIRVGITPEQTDDVRVSKFSLTLLRLELMKNVDTDTYGLNDGSVLVYNTENASWVVTPFSELTIDGGFY